MEDDKWDSENARTAAKSSPMDLLSSQWDGEDEDEDVKDCWDDPEEEDADKKDKDKETEDVKPPVADQVKKTKKYLLKDEDERKRIPQEVADNKEKTYEEIQAEKLRLKMLQEEADLEVAKHLLGVSIKTDEKVKIKELESKEDFDKYSEEIIRQIGSATKNGNFPGFVDNLIQQLCVHLSASDIKKVHTWIGNLQIEKNKLEQGSKAKKKGKTKAKLNVFDVESDIYSSYNEGDLYDDFM